MKKRYLAFAVLCAMGLGGPITGGRSAFALPLVTAPDAGSAVIDVQDQGRERVGPIRPDFRGGPGQRNYVPPTRERNAAPRPDRGGRAGSPPDRGRHAGPPRDRRDGWDGRSHRRWDGDRHRDYYRGPPPRGWRGPYWGPNYGGWYGNGRGNGAWVGPGLFGFGGGVVITPPAARAGPPPTRNGLAPWTSAWYRYCSNKYKSFNPQTGLYLGYDGKYHYCR